MITSPILNSIARGRPSALLMIMMAVMLRVALGALFILLVTLVGFATKYLSPQPISENDRSLVSLLVNELHQESFPEVRPETISYGQFSSEKVFLRVNPDPGSLFGKESYVLHINSKLLEALKNKTLSRIALKAILAHELCHIVDYQDRSPAQLLQVGWNELLDQQAEYERSIDLAAFERGYAAGIAEFRTWLYRNIPSSALAIKKANYYTPTEIEAWVVKQAKK